jgi:hypothetical protein
MCWFQECHEYLERGVLLCCQNLVSKWLQARIFHKGHVFHFFSSDWVNDCICMVLLGPMVTSQGDGHVGRLHPQKCSWDKFRGERFCECNGTLRGAGLLVISVTTLGSNGAWVVS